MIKRLELEMFMLMRRSLCLVSLLVSVLTPGLARAHYCSNIWTGPARLVIQPEQPTLHVVAGQKVSLKVYLQNNFPYKLLTASMRGTATGYTIAVTPPSQAVGPGQKVLFTFSVTATSTADIQVSTLSLQVQFRVGGYRGNGDVLVNQSPSQATLVGRASGNGGEQAPALSAATLIDKYATATLPAASPYFGRTGALQLVSWFGHRFCYDSGGGWRSGSNNCPTPTAEGAAWTSIDIFPQDCMRAGIELGAHKAKLGSALDPARAGATNAVTKGGSMEHRCLAAVVGGMLWQGGASGPFEIALNGLSSTICKNAGLRALGKGSQATCSSGNYYEKAACAAAEALAGNDSQVTPVLVANAGDGENGSGGSWQASHYYSYMLYLVTQDRYGKGQQPPWYAAVGPGPEAAPPKKDTGPVGPGREARYSEAGQILPGLEPAPIGSDGSAPPGGDGGKRPEDGGCGCTLAARPVAGAALAILLLVPALLVLARRRR